MGARRASAARHCDIVPLRIAAALTNHLELRVRVDENITKHFEIAVAEPYAWNEGGSDDDWVKSYEALRKGLKEQGQRACFFTRRYTTSFTLNIAILAGDGESITQILLGAATDW